MVYLPTKLGDFWDKCRYIFQHHGAFGILFDHFAMMHSASVVNLDISAKPQKKTGYCQRWGEKSWEELQHGAPLAHQATHFVMFLGNSKQQMQRSPGQERQLVLEGPFFWICFGKGKYPSVGWYVVSKTCTSIICGFHHGLFYSSFWDESTIHFPAGVVRSSPWENSCFSQWNHNRRRRFSGWRRRRRRVMPRRSSGGVSHGTEKLLVNNGL